MPRSLISLGANLGDTYETMLAASRMLQEQFGASNIRFSRLYRTPPVGGPGGQSEFLNAVALIDSDHSVWRLWETVKRVETALGRQRQHRWEARRIDMDILLHDHDRIWTPHLKVPHPRMCMRTFVLTPATEIAPQVIDPVTQWSIAALARHLDSSAGSPIIVYCNSEPTTDQLEAYASERLQGSGHESESSDVHFHFLDRPESAVECDKNKVARLHIFAVQTPDPETIQWEDFSYPWARALGLVPGVTPNTAFSGPRYLMPANDLVWADHEIIAAQSAMRCPVVALDLPFGTR